MRGRASPALSTDCAALRIERYADASRRVQTERLRAHFFLLFLSRPTIQPSAMLAAIKGLSRHKRFPPHARRESVGIAHKGHVSAARGSPPFIPRPLDRRCAWRCSEGVGTGNVFRAGQVRRNPCRGRRTGNMTKKIKNKRRVRRLYRLREERLIEPFDMGSRQSRVNERAIRDARRGLNAPIFGQLEQVRLFQCQLEQPFRRR